LAAGQAVGSAADVRAMMAAHVEPHVRAMRAPGANRWVLLDSPLFLPSATTAAHVHGWANHRHHHHALAGQLEGSPTHPSTTERLRNKVEAAAPAPQQCLGRVHRDVTGSSVDVASFASSCSQSKQHMISSSSHPEPATPNLPLMAHLALHGSGAQFCDGVAGGGGSSDSEANRGGKPPAGYLCKGDCASW
jgi:hypothetical protein